MQKGVLRESTMGHIRSLEVLEFLKRKNFQPTVVNLGTKLVNEPCSSHEPKLGGICFLQSKRWIKTKLVVSVQSFLILSNEIEKPELRKLKAEVKKLCITLILVDSPRKAFVTVLDKFFNKRMNIGVSEHALIDSSSEIDPSVTIMAGAVIGPNTKIGARTVISENCVIKEKTFIGKNCFLAPGVCIGNRGFGYERDVSGRLIHFSHHGGVKIGSNVEIGANTVVDRGTLGDTTIENGVKIDNLCHIGHNAIIKRDSVIIAMTQIGGSSITGPRAWLAPSVTTMNGIEVGRDTTVGLGSVVVKPVKENTTVVGNPAQPIEKFLENKKNIEKLLKFDD